MAVFKIYDGTAWITIIAKVWDGAAWQEKLKYHDGVAFIDLFGVAYVVALGADGSESDADMSPYDSRAGCRLDYNGGTDGRMQDGNSPNGGGPITSWGENRVLATPAGYASNIFEYQWVEVSDSGVSAKITPVAASTWQTFGGTKTWYATKTTAGFAAWVIDITVREIADVTNSDTRRYTLNVEGII